MTAAWVAVFVLALSLAHPGIAGAAGESGSTDGAPLPGATPATDRSGGTLHGNHLTVGNQVVGDGRVLVESAALMSDGYVAIHRTENGSRGAVVGHTHVSLGRHVGIEVPIEPGVLPEEGSVTLRAVLYGDDGDGEFDPESDRTLRSFGSETEGTFSARAGEGSVAVLADGLQGQPSTGSVTLDRVELDRPGHVVLHADRDLEPGAVVGRTALDAGTHHNVTVELDDEFFADQDERFHLWAVLYPDDGDGGVAADPITVGGDPVASRFPVLRVDDGNGTTGVGVNTPGSTVAVSTPDPTPSATTREAATATPTAGGSSGSGGLPLPGFGAALAVLAVLGYLLVRRR